MTGNKILLAGVGADSSNVEPVPDLKDSNTYDYIPIPETWLTAALSSSVRPIDYCLRTRLPPNSRIPISHKTLDAYFDSYSRACLAPFFN